MNSKIITLSVFVLTIAVNAQSSKLWKQAFTISAKTTIDENKKSLKNPNLTLLIRNQM